MATIYSVNNFVSFVYLYYQKVDSANFTKKDIVEAVPYIINVKEHLWNTLDLLHN
jgi:hypothetical protein